MAPLMPLVTVDARMIDRSGIGTYLRNVLSRLLATRAELRFRLLGGEAVRRVAGVRRHGVEHRSATSPIYSVQEQLELRRLSPRDGDLFWSPHYNVPLLHRGPLVATIHDLAHLAVPGLVAGRHRLAYSRFMLKAAGRAAATIFVSRFSADEYLRIFGRRARAPHVIHQGVDTSWFECTASSPPGTRPYLLFVGNVKPHKNVTGLLHAFELLKDEFPHDLVVVGQREGFIHGSPEVAREAARLGNRVRFTGWLDEEEVKRHFAHADALVFPSFYEGFGLPTLEAMACGCPVVASNVASIPEVCGDAVLYCDPGSPDSIAAQVRRLLRDVPLRDELISRGRERARLFTWERCAAETGEILQSSLRG